MTQLGMRELKENMGRFVATLRKKGALTLSYRGKPLAVVTMIDPSHPTPSNETKLLAKLQKEGLISGGSGQLSERTQPMLLGGRSISDIVLESRE